MKFPRFKQKSASLLGLDICQNYIKLLELENVGESFQINNFVIFDIKDIQNQQNHIEINDSQQNPLDAKIISDTLTLLKIKSSHTAIALSDTDVMSKIITFDASCTLDEIDKQIELEYIHEFQHKKSLLHYDFQILGPSPQSPHIINVLLAAAEQQQINKRVATAKQIGFNVKVVDITSLAIVRACQLIPELKPNAAETQIVAVFHLQITHVTLIALQNLIPFYSNTLSVQYNGTEIGQTSSFVQRLQFSYQRFLELHPNVNINCIILCGDVDNLLALSEEVASEFNKKCLVANPFTHFSIAEHCDKEIISQRAAQMMVCCGLAMRTNE